jgi:hypothetical protein
MFANITTLNPPRPNPAVAGPTHTARGNFVGMDPTKYPAQSKLGGLNKITGL